MMRSSAVRSGRGCRVGIPSAFPPPTRRRRCRSDTHSIRVLAITGAASLGAYEHGNMTERGEEAVAATGVMPDAAGSTVAGPGSPVASCGTAKRLRLLGWLQRTAPQLAPVYAGAVTMAFDGDFPGRLVFVWHAIREIRNRRPDAVAGSSPHRRFSMGISRVRSDDAGSRIAGPTTARSR
jgi:hypothetical protein